MKEKKKIKITIGLMCLICLLATFCFSYIQNVVFATCEVICQFNGGTLNNGSIDYTINNHTISIELATKDGDSTEFNKVSIKTEQQTIDLDAATYYLRITDKDNANLVNNGSIINDIPGDGYIMLDEGMFNNKGVGIFELSAKQPNPEEQQDPSNPGELVGPTDPVNPVEPVGPQTIYPIVAYFEGINTGIEMSEDGTIILPDGWTTGKVTFKAKICTVGGVISPDNGYNIPDSDSQQEITVRVEGIANGVQLNGTVIGSEDRSFVTFNNGFENCGKATIHITSVEESGPVNTIINIVDKNIMYVTAIAPLAMSMSVGSEEVTQAIITKNEEKSVSVFFGNSEVTLNADGLNVDKIIGVTGGNGTTLNNDGSATVKLSKLSEETTTKVEITILLKDGSSIKRTINIKRTAILLNYDERENKLKIGYVMNKTYLYNNQLHNDNIFDAYIHVILYKGHTVAEYRQIKVNDEEIINALVNGTQYKGMNLPADGSWSIETFDTDAMKIDLSEMDGITKASVFLTNGPLQVDKELTSVEYGVGSGLTIELEAE